MRKRILILLIILVSLFAFSINYPNEIEFFEYYLINYTHVNQKTTMAMSERLLYLYKNQYINYKIVSPIELIAYMFVETNYRNIPGDNYESLGYFQIQKDAYYYVRNYCKDEAIVPKISWVWDEVRPLIKTQITVSALYLQYIREHNNLHSWLSISKYNGHNDSSIYYASKINNKLAEILAIFYEWKTGGVDKIVVKK